MTIIMIATLRDVKDHQKIVGYRLIETEGMTMSNYPTQTVVKLLQLGHKVFNIRLSRGRVCSQNPGIKIRDFPALVRLDDNSYQVVENKGQFVLVQRANKDKLRLMRYDGEVFDFDRVTAGFLFETGKLKLPNAKILDVKTEALNNQKFNCLTCMPYDGDRFPLDETDNAYEMSLHNKLQAIQAKYDVAKKKEKQAQVREDNNQEDLSNAGNLSGDLEKFQKYWKIVRKSGDQIILCKLKEEYKDLMSKESNADKTLVIPEGITVINEDVFKNSIIGTVVFPSTLRSIQSGAFYNARIKEIKFNDGLIQIYGLAFEGVKGIETVDIPDQVISIADYAFQGSSVREVRLHGKLKSCGEKAFQNCENLQKLYIDTPKCEYGFQCFSLNANLTDLKLKQFGKFKQECFVGCINLKEFIANCAGSLIGELTFNECHQLQKVVIGPKIKKVNIQFLGITRVSYADDIQKKQNYCKNTDVYLPQNLGGLDEYDYNDHTCRTFYFGVAARLLLCTFHVEQYSKVYDKINSFNLRTISDSFKIVTYNKYSDKIDEYKNNNERGVVEDSIRRASLLSRDPEELILRKIKQKAECYESTDAVDLKLNVPKIDRQTWFTTGVNCPKALSNEKRLQSAFSYQSWRDDVFTRFYFAWTVNYLTRTFKNDEKLLQILDNEYLQFGFENCGIHQILKFQEYNETTKENEVFQLIELQLRHRALSNFLNILVIVDQQMQIYWASLVPIRIDVPVQRSIPKDTLSQILYPGDMFDQVNNHSLNRTTVQGYSMTTDAAYDVQLTVLKWIQNQTVMIRCDFDDNVEYMILPIENIVYKLTRIQNRTMVGYRYSYSNCKYKVEDIKHLNDAGDQDKQSDNAWWKLNATVLMQNKAYKEFSSIIKNNAKLVKTSELTVQKVTKIQGIMIKYFGICKNYDQLKQLLTISDWIELFDSELIEPIDQDVAEDCINKYRVPKYEYSLKIDNNQALYVYTLIKQTRINRPSVKGDGTRQGILYSGKELPSNYLYVLKFIDGTKIYGHQAYTVQNMLVTLCDLVSFGENEVLKGVQRQQKEEERARKRLWHTTELYDLAKSGTFIRPDEHSELVIRIDERTIVKVGKCDMPLNKGYGRAIVFINPVNGCVYLGCQSKGSDYIIPFLPLKDLDSGIDLLKKLKNQQENSAYNMIYQLQQYFSTKSYAYMNAMLNDEDLALRRAANFAALAFNESDNKLDYRKNSGLDSDLYDEIAVKNSNVFMSMNEALGIE